MFNRALAGVFIGCVIGLIPAAGPCPADEKRVDLNLGDAAPAFEAKSDQGTTWTSAEHYGKKWVVVYFFPGDFTPGCTAQANAFRDAMNKLTARGVEVIGVSGDSAESHSLFKKVQKLNFTLLADEDGAVHDELRRSWRNQQSRGIDRPA